MLLFFRLAALSKSLHRKLCGASLRLARQKNSAHLH
jgi:hypothetical protein